ncbi:hypothetical protein MS3_00008848 [Schistosoma haematobium]|uniref:Uncharacterized protein n=2 Tax=Schistosoma haematobium TaxID=6185 RepID=A0A922LFU1_SCHHA|nr:hypothetical protein MS3_00008848 [Schistosoma haematobium]KAH9581831.1 hypothetical protein MS3_00008848 [Schistosoma haematobium]
MNRSIPLKQMKETELFDITNQLKLWAINMYHLTATKDQKKYDPIELILRILWDDIHVNNEKPEYYDNNRIKLPKSNILFSTTFKNNTDSEQEYNFHTERCTRSIIEIEIQKGVIITKELSLKLALPNSIMEANAGFKHEISIGSSTRQSTEEELAWGVDTRITVPPRHSAFAEVKIEEEEMNCCFRLKTSMYGRIRILFLDPIHDNTLIKYLEGDLGTIIQESLKSDRFKQNNHEQNSYLWTESMVNSNQRIFYIETIGKCKFRFGVHQFVEVNQKVHLENNNNNNNNNN